MFQRNPSIESRVPLSPAPNYLEDSLKEDYYDASLSLLELDFTLPENDLLEDQTYDNETLVSDEKIIKRLHRKRSLAKKAIATSLILGMPVAAYASDVRSNIALSNEAKPTIRVMNEALNEEASDKATIFYHGFNTFGASDLVRSIGEGVQQAYDGQQWSVQYNNAPLDTDDITEAVNKQIEESGIRSVDIVTYSMGDIPGIETAVDIINEGKTNVESITILSGPADYEGLTKTTQNELKIANDLAWVPWIEHSTPFRYLAEVYFYKDAIEKNPTVAIDGINTRFKNGDVTTNLFLSSQINSIGDADLANRFDEIDETKFHPVINYVRIKDNNDTVVDNDYSSKKICEYAKSKGLICNIFEVESQHGLYWKNPEEYNKVFSRIGHATKPQIEAERERYLLQQYYHSRTTEFTATDEEE